ncbi:MAG TPA: hypothetical protein VIK37_01205 [Candidatus Saccharimonadales bacterium]
MGRAERVPQPIDEPEHEAAVFALSFENKETSRDSEIEAMVLGSMLSASNRDFILRQSEIYDAHPYKILEAAVASYKEMCELVEAGGTIFVRGQDGRLHKISSDEPESPPAG